MADAAVVHRWDERLAQVGGWRGHVLGPVHWVVLGAVPDMVEEWQWAKPTKPGDARPRGRLHERPRRGPPSRSTATATESPAPSRPGGSAASLPPKGA